MGGCMSDEATKKDAAITREMQKDKKLQLDEVKLLLLGTGESGKSTVFKQMKILQDHGGFTPEELDHYKRVVLGNCISQMKTLVAASTKLDQPLEVPGNQEKALRISQLDGVGSWTPEIGQIIQQLWADDGIKKTFKERDRAFQLDDSAAYLFDNIGRFTDPSYIPTNEDVLRARSRTTGIEEAIFHFEDMSFRMIDVGGQRSERRKWIHCFDCVTAVLFCVAMSEYDQVLREDVTQPRMRESLLLFEEISNSPWFKHISFIMFFNKYDLFQDKIERVPLNKYFPKYTGTTAKHAERFIADMFVELVTASNKKPYIHYTVATDPNNMEKVFFDVRKTIMNEIIAGLGIGI